MKGSFYLELIVNIKCTYCSKTPVFVKISKPVWECVKCPINKKYIWQHVFHICCGLNRQSWALFDFVIASICSEISLNNSVNNFIPSG